MSNPPIKIVRIIARLNLGGPAKHVTWLTLGLDTERFHQTLVCGNVEPGEDDMAPLIRAAGVEPIVIPELGRSINPKRDIKSLLAVLGILFRQKPDIIHTHTSKAGFVGRAAGLIYNFFRKLTFHKKAKIVHTFHGHTFHSYFGRLKARLFLTIEQTLAQLATDKIVVISPRQLDEIHNDFNVGLRSQFALIPLGIDADLWADPTPGRAKFRREFGLDDDTMAVGAVGRVAPVKNYGLFVEAVAELEKTYPAAYNKCHFFIIGGGSRADLDALARQARDSGVADRFTVAGPRTDPENFFAGLDLMALTSLNEGTPLSLIEAMAAGKTFVATDVGGVPDVAGPLVAKGAGFNYHLRGLLAQSQDGAGLATAMKRLIDDPDLRQRLADNGQKNAREYYHKSRLITDVADLYHDLTTE